MSLAGMRQWLAAGNTIRLCLRAAGALLLFALLQLSASPVFAHAAFIGALPADGAMLDSVPADVMLHFNEPVAPLVFQLVLPDGSVHPLPHVATQADGLKVELPPSTVRGTFLLSWRVVSADGHPVGGTLSYSVGVPSAGTAAAGAAASPALSWPLLASIWLTRFVLYGALFIGVGGSLFRAFVLRSATPPPRWLDGALAIGLAMLPLCLGLQGLDALALPWSGLWSPQAWQAALATAYGSTIIWMLAALLVAVVCNRAKPQIARPAILLALVALGAALAASGHASSAPPAWIARPAVFIHAVTIAAWVGSLAPLLVVLKEGTGNLALQRFSRIIPWVLAMLLASGVTLALLQLDGLQSLWRTGYGRILSAKLVLVLLLLALAAVNRYRLTARVRLGDARARQAMRRLIKAELLLVLMVLALVATWRFTPPPRALVLPSISVHLHADKVMADLSLTMQHDDRLRANIYLQDSEFNPLAAQEVTLEFSNPALGIQPLQKEARQQTAGAWLVEPFALPATGRWHVRIYVLLSEFERIELDTDIKMPIANDTEYR